MPCKICADFFRKDGNMLCSDLLEKKVTLLCSKIRLELFVTDEAELALYAGGSDGDIELAKKKIAFCPMCGEKLER